MSSVRFAVVVTALNFLLLAGTLVSRGAASGQAPSPLLRGRALELVDERGQIRARLNVESGGAVVLRLLDDRGTIRVKLGADQEGSGLLLANGATEPGIHLLAKTAGSSMRVVNPDGRERVIAP
jgi:hypothetical protein